jgi:hypothetical protein
VKRNGNSKPREIILIRKSELTALPENGSISRRELKDGKLREYTLGVRTWLE